MGEHAPLAFGIGNAGGVGRGMLGWRLKLIHGGMLKSGASLPIIKDSANSHRKSERQFASRQIPVVSA